MTQRLLFDPPQPTLPPRDPNVTTSDVPRLTGQNAAILARLKQGPATNVELAAMALKYGGRISDLRAAGYRIECERGEGGINTYRLIDAQGGAQGTARPEHGHA